MASITKQKWNDDPNKGLASIIEKAMSHFDAGSASIMLPDENGRLRIRASYGIDPRVVENACIDGTCERGFGSNSSCVYRTGEERLVETEPGVVGVSYTSNSMCIPIRYNKDIIGVFNISNRKKGNFTDKDLFCAVNYIDGIAGKISIHNKEPAEIMPETVVARKYVPESSSMTL